MLIASPLQAELVERIRAVDPRSTSSIAPICSPSRATRDHHPPIQRSPTQAAEWAAPLAEAEVLFDVDGPSTADFTDRVPRLRWIQASSSGIGEWVRMLGIVDSPIVVTNAAGIHSVPLAEFVVFAMLYFARGWPRMVAEQRAHHWERCAIETLGGKTLGIVGMGNVGRTVARPGEAIRAARPWRPPEPVRRADRRRRRHGVRSRRPEHRARARAIIWCCACRTRGNSRAAGRRRDRVDQTRRGVDQHCARHGRRQAGAHRRARSGQLRGAALDVVAREPLAADSPLWDMPNPNNPQQQTVPTYLCPSDSARAMFYADPQFTADKQFAKGNYAAYSSPMHTDLQRFTQAL